MAFFQLWCSNPNLLLLYFQKQETWRTRQYEISPYFWCISPEQSHCWKVPVLYIMIKKFALTEAAFPLAPREVSRGKCHLAIAALFPVLRRQRTFTSVWLLSFQSLSLPLGFSKSSSAQKRAPCPITQLFFWLWALVPACPTYSLLTFMPMSGPMLLWLLTGFMSLLTLVPCCHPVISSSHRPEQGLPPCLQLQGKEQQLLKWSIPIKPSLMADLLVWEISTNKGRWKCNFSSRVLGIFLLCLISFKVSAFMCKHVKEDFFLSQNLFSPKDM